MKNYTELPTGTYSYTIKSLRKGKEPNTMSVILKINTFNGYDGPTIYYGDAYPFIKDNKLHLHGSFEIFFNRLNDVTFKEKIYDHSNKRL